MADNLARADEPQENGEQARHLELLHSEDAPPTVDVLPTRRGRGVVIGAAAVLLLVVVAVGVWQFAEYRKQQRIEAADQHYLTSIRTAHKTLTSSASRLDEIVGDWEDGTSKYGEVKSDTADLEADVVAALKKLDAAKPRAKYKADGKEVTTALKSLGFAVDSFDTYASEQAEHQVRIEGARPAAAYLANLMVAAGVTDVEDAMLVESSGCIDGTWNTVSCNQIAAVTDNQEQATKAAERYNTDATIVNDDAKKVRATVGKRVRLERDFIATTVSPTYLDLVTEEYAKVS